MLSWIALRAFCMCTWVCLWSITLYLHLYLYKNILEHTLKPSIRQIAKFRIESWGPVLTPGCQARTPQWVWLYSSAVSASESAKSCSCPLWWLRSRPLFHLRTYRKAEMGFVKWGVSFRKTSCNWNPGTLINCDLKIYPGLKQVANVWLYIKNSILKQVCRNQ